MDENPIHLTEDGWIIVQFDPVEFENISFKNLQLFDQRKYQ